MKLQNDDQKNTTLLMVQNCNNFEKINHDQSAFLRFWPQLTWSSAMLLDH